MNAVKLSAVVGGVAIVAKILYSSLFRKVHKKYALSKLIDIRPYCLECNAHKGKELCSHGSGLEPMYEILEEATETIDLCMYVCTDPIVLDILLRAKGKGVKIRVITDYTMAFATKSNITPLHSAGVAIRWKESVHAMHHKCCIIDNVIVLTGSFNWTDNATRGNYENLLILTNPQGVAKYRDMFEHLWNDFTPFRLKETS